MGQSRAERNLQRILWRNNPEQRNLQRILWRKHKDEAVKSYTLNTVTYGTASAPFLAVRCLKQLAFENEVKYPEASRIISSDFYVDDMITGGETFESTLSITHHKLRLLRGRYDNRRRNHKLRLLRGRYDNRRRNL
ncbi:hypothetical protein QE152_g25594 [Popillia japonica]|uniref:Reverse transcriptase n=1 Tax=Popillia japonica TaxID=7064 RepID=A0AAW1K1F6_POPJA